VWESHTRIKTVIIDNPTEKVSDFQYLIYYIADYKNDLEDKLQKYNKQNGITKRHFGIQTTKETNGRIHNITAKVAIKFVSEAWVLKKRDERRLEASHMKFLRHLLGTEKLYWEMNQYIRDKLGVQNTGRDIQKYQEMWLQHLQRMDSKKIPKQALQDEPRERRSIGCRKNSWEDQLDC
jgi:hypothetical protein